MQLTILKTIRGSSSNYVRSRFNAIHQYHKKNSSLSNDSPLRYGRPDHLGKCGNPANHKGEDLLSDQLTFPPGVSGRAHIQACC